MRKAAVTMDDIHTATGCLHALLRCIYEVSTGIQYKLPDGRDDVVANQLSSLIILARDEAERIDHSVEICISGGRAQP
jgi:hypothetical protein